MGKIEVRRTCAMLDEMFDLNVMVSRMNGLGAVSSDTITQFVEPNS